MENQPPSGSVIEPAHSSTPPPPLNGPPPTQNSNSLKIILLLISLLLAGLAAWFWLLRAQPPTTETETKKEVPIIRFGVLEGPIDTFYPTTGLGSDEFDVNNQVFESLVRYENQTKIVPALATGWTNPDDSTWVFTIKSGVKFHTGKMLTAADVKASLDASKDTDRGQLFATTITSVEATDDYTVKITTADPDPVLLNKLTFLHIYDTSEGTKPNHPDNGSGPYTLKPGTEIAKDKLELVPYEDYHGGRASVRELQFRLFEDEEKLVEAMQAGQINIGGTIDESNIVVLKAKNFEPFETNALNVYHIFPNSLREGSPLQKAKVREALYLATDIDALLTARKVKGRAASQIVPEDIPGYNPVIKRPARDVAKAKALLAEAGYPDGVTLTLTHFSQAQDAFDELARQLKEANITLKSDSIEDVSVLGPKAFSGGTEAYFGSYSSDVLDAIDVFTQLFQTNGNYKNATVDKLIAEANSTLDAGKRLKVLQDISKVLMDDFGWIPLYNQTFIWGFDQPYVVTKNVPGGGLGLYFWQVYLK